MQVTQPGERLRWWVALSVIALVGLGLRIAAARGGLWTDEAWSVIYAAQARDPVGVFLRINHDNNHHLYSLWLQAIGPAAPPILARAPAIAAGVLCILVAAVFAGRRSAAAGLVAALLFAVTPIFVAFGSEARGYSMMLLAALAMLLLVGDTIDERPTRGVRWWLALTALLGMLSHLTMVAPIGIAALWVYLEWRARLGPAVALPKTLSLMAPALVATLLVVVLVVTAAALSPTGMRIGGYEAFSAPRFTAALDDLALWSSGLRSPWPWLVPVFLGAGALALGVQAPAWLGPRARLYALLILAVPLAAGLLRVGNTSFARYYLASALGLLFFMADWIGRGLAARTSIRMAAGLLAVTVVGASLYRDEALIATERGRSADALAEIAALSPSGANIAFAEPRLKAVIAVAAQRTGYPARFAPDCAPADFLLAAQSRWKATAVTVTRCGVRMSAIDSSITTPLTGDSWVLYRRQYLAKPLGG